MDMEGITDDFILSLDNIISEDNPKSSDLERLSSLSSDEAFEATVKLVANSVPNTSVIGTIIPLHAPTLMKIAQDSIISAPADPTGYLHDSSQEEETKVSNVPRRQIKLSSEGENPDSEAEHSIADSYYSDSGHENDFDILAEKNDTNGITLSFCSEYNESPDNSHRELTPRLSDIPSGHEDEETEIQVRQSEPKAQRPFSPEDLCHFNPNFGRDVFYEQLGQSIVNSSSSKSTWDSIRQSSLRRSISSAGIIKKGWLVKKGKVVPSWRRRWFILQNTHTGPILTYAKDKKESTHGKIIHLTSTSRCIILDVSARPSKEHEFKLIASGNSALKEYCIAAESSFELTSWISAIQGAINAENKSTIEGSSDFQRIWNENGIQGFLIRYGVRKLRSKSHLQTRVIELNFAENIISNTRRGETLTALSFDDLSKITLISNRILGEEYGIELEFKGKHRAWPLYLDSLGARDDFYKLLQKIMDKNVTGEDLEARCSRMTLKSGVMSRKRVSHGMKPIGPHATVKGRLYVLLHENSIVFYPEAGDFDGRPWYVMSLKDLDVYFKADKGVITLGRLGLMCDTIDECRSWYRAIICAIGLPLEMVHTELRNRLEIRHVFHRTVERLRQLLKANVKPEVNGPPKDYIAIDMMIKALWKLVFPNEEFTSNADTRWQQLGFQRGGPASDLRASGLLGLYCLIYFERYPTGEFQRILERTRYGVSEGNMKNYPFAIACINVVATLTEMLGFGDAGSHSEGCSISAMKTFVTLVARHVEQKMDPSNGCIPDEWEEENDLQSLNSFGTFEELVNSAHNHVFEDMFCLVFPILDALFVQMGAGYMEFGQVLASFRRRLVVIFDSHPKSIKELGELANEPCTDTLVAPSIVSKVIK